MSLDYRHELSSEQRIPRNLSLDSRSLRMRVQESPTVHSEPLVDLVLLEDPDGQQTRPEDLVLRHEHADVPLPPAPELHPSTLGVRDLSLVLHERSVPKLLDAEGPSSW